MNKWQSIKSAPRYEPVLLAGGVCKYEDGTTYASPTPVIATSWHKKRVWVIEHTGEKCEGIVENPTHWSPLPQPPKK